eukprot:tig00020556_g11031.t1
MESASVRLGSWDSQRSLHLRYSAVQHAHVTNLDELGQVAALHCERAPASITVALSGDVLLQKEVRFESGDVVVGGPHW